MWKTPRNTQSYWVQEVLAPGVSPLKVDLLMRTRKFFRGLLNSPSPEVVTAALLAARDIRTTLGSNLSLIERESGLNSWTASPTDLKKALLENSNICIPDEDKWRIPFLKKLLTKRLELKYMSDSTDAKELLNSLIYSLSIN